MAMSRADATLFRLHLQLLQHLDKRAENGRYHNGHRRQAVSSFPGEGHDVTVPRTSFDSGWAVEDPYTETPDAVRVDMSVLTTCSTNRISFVVRATKIHTGECIYLWCSHDLELHNWRRSYPNALDRVRRLLNCFADPFLD